MRKINSFLVAAVTMFAAVSCAPELKHEEQKVTGETITFTAFADGADTKTTLSGQKSLWAGGDRIWILTGNLEDESWKKAYSTSDAGDKAIFTPEDESTVLEGDKYFAVYPASAGDNAAWDGEGDIRNVYLKSNQTATLNSYDPEAHIAVAQSSTNSLEFKNAVSLLKFKVANDDVKSVTIFAIGNEKLTGSCNVSAEGNVTPWTGEGEANHWVELTAGEGTFETDKEYVAAVFPNTLAQGFTVEFSFGGAKKAVKSLEKSFEFERNTIYNFGTLNYVAPTVVNKIYLKPNVWTSDNAWYSAHFWGTGIQPTDVTLEESDADGIFEVEVPEGATDVIFCRMNPEYNTFGWDEMDEGGTVVKDRVWNQTGELSIPAIDDDKVCYFVSGWDTYSWITLDDAATPVEPEQPEVDAAKYGLVGSFQGWSAEDPIAMINAEDGWIVSRGVELYKDDEFKFVQDKSWDVSYGTSAVTVLQNDVEADLVTGGQNMKVSNNGTFDIYFNPNAMKVKVVCVEEKKFNVNITIDNKANWSPLYIYLEKGGEPLTPVSGSLVTNNVYAVSADYIGEDLTYQLISGAKKTEKANLTITRNGATVTLEETIVKLTFHLESDNAKQWWGTTSKLYVWNTGTSFDVGWPGHTMTFDGNYTWHIQIPSELVGKKINYIINNGNGWQSANQEGVLVPAEGLDVYETKIGIK